MFKGTTALACGTTETTYLVIKPDVLVAGLTYTFRATVTDDSTLGFSVSNVGPRGWALSVPEAQLHQYYYGRPLTISADTCVAQLALTVVNAPSGGRVTVSSYSGKALVDYFNLSCTARAFPYWMATHYSINSQNFTRDGCERRITLRPYPRP